MCSNFHKENDHVAKHQEAYLTGAVVVFARRTLDYMRLYLNIGVIIEEWLSFDDLENQRRRMKKIQSRRDVTEIERGYITAVM